MCREGVVTAESFDGQDRVVVNVVAQLQRSDSSPAVG
jgi:hypothetical protein